MDYVEEDKEYVATVQASSCETWRGFRHALAEAFSLPDEAKENVNDINCYIFSPWLGHRKVRMVFVRSGSLKKCSIYHELRNLLELWKTDFERRHPGNSFVFEFL